MNKKEFEEAIGMSNDIKRLNDIMEDFETVEIVDKSGFRLVTDSDNCLFSEIKSAIFEKAKELIEAKIDEKKEKLFEMGIDY